jgi:hypothetical protein
MKFLVTALFYNAGWHHLMHYLLTLQIKLHDANQAQIQCQVKFFDKSVVSKD